MRRLRLKTGRRLDKRGLRLKEEMVSKELEVKGWGCRSHQTGEKEIEK